MKRLIDWKRFGNAFRILSLGIIPTHLEFAQRKLIGRITVYLVGGHVNERCLWTDSASRFQQIHRPYSVDVEVIPWPASREVVTGLSGGVYCRIGFQFRKQAEERGTITDIQFVMGIARVSPFEPYAVPARVALLAKKIGAHVVIHPIHLPA